jgi:hypothetical protein
VSRVSSTEPDPRPESAEQRADRNLIELLQELRVAGLGVQVLFGFLLSIPFTSRFARLSAGQRDLYVTTLVMAAASTALLLGPVAYHRLVFRMRQKEQVVRAANVMALAGLGLVCLDVTAAVALVLSYVTPGLPAVVLTGMTFVLLAGLWFAYPLTRRPH